MEATTITTKSGQTVEVVSMAAFTRETGVGLCLDHTAKMEDMRSLSTSPNCELCNKRSKDPNSICAHCYSRRMMEIYPNLKAKLERNDWVLKYTALTVVLKIRTKLGAFRFEAFGDIETVTQVFNYFNIAEANPDTDFSLWTKNPWIIDDAVDKLGAVKPDNLTIIGSSWRINRPMRDYFESFDCIDHIFTVYDKDFIKGNNVEIQCGGKSCKECGCKCYKHGHKSFEINEQLK